jgi:hypothetical protein
MERPQLNLPPQTLVGRAEEVAANAMVAGLQLFSHTVLAGFVVGERVFEKAGTLKRVVEQLPTPCAVVHRVLPTTSRIFERTIR